MKCLILGGSRFIGRRLVSVLLEAGAQVTLFNRGQAGHPFGDRLEQLKGDRRSASDLAAAFGRREFDAAWDFLSYDETDARMAIAALGGRVGHFIHISTCSVYWCTGDSPCPVPETDFDRLDQFDERPDSIEYEYGYGKRKAERALFDAHARGGFPVTTIRMPIVGGEQDPSLRYASYCLRIADGGPLALPDGGYAPFRHVYVGDVARALAELPAKPQAKGQAYNLACAEILNLRSIVASISRLMGRTVETVDIPTPVLRAMGLPGAFSPFSQQSAQVPAIWKARNELGWDPTPHPVWLERVVRDALGNPVSEPPPALAFRGKELEVIANYWQAIKRAEI